MKVLLDTNVILDFALERAPFFEHAVRIIEEANRADIRLFITASAVTDVYYMLSKGGRNEQARDFLWQLTCLMDVCPVDRETIVKALASDFADLEDAVQCFAAEAFGAEIIVTRNKADFATASLKALTPGEFCDRYLPRDASIAKMDRQAEPPTLKNC